MQTRDEIIRQEGMMGSNGAPKMQQIQVPIEDMAVIAADLACFAIASIVGGASNQQAAMTANNLLVREVRRFTEFKRLHPLLSPQISFDYLNEMHQRVFQELQQLAAVSLTAHQKKEEKQPWISKQKLKRLALSCWPWKE
jgi:hypothetical protein